MRYPRWTKLWRDLNATQGRVLMMVLAIAISLFGVGSILSAYSILSREMQQNYLGTHPASAYIELDRVDDALLKAVRQRPNVAAAEAGDWITARAEVAPDTWMPVLLFVIPDFGASQLGTFTPISGTWPPPERGLLVEREVLPMLKRGLGDGLTVKTPNGPKRNMPIVGSVHDPSLAPAWQEQTVYGYITPATLAWLGEGDALHILKIGLRDPPANAATIAAAMRDLSGWLTQQGYRVDEVRIPPPLKHPHQSQMNAVLTLLLVFTILALVLGAVLTATMINGMLAQQVRQIGIMKALGARSRQISTLYVAMVAVLSAVATALGVPTGVAAGRGFARVVAQLLNLNLSSEAVPSWVYIALVLLGILVPLLIALVPIGRAMRITVRESIQDYGVQRDRANTRGLLAWLTRARGIDNTLRMTLRNSFRRRARLALTLGLLAGAGGMFMTGMNVKSGWERYLERATADRHYDLELRLNQPQSVQTLVARIEGVSGVVAVEAWNISPAAIAQPDGLTIVQTYPDGGHGSFTLRAAPPQSDFISTPLLNGRWLDVDSVGEVVLNQTAAALFPTAKPGDVISLMADGRRMTLRLRGVIQQILTPATAYVSPDTFAQGTGLSSGMSNAVRVRMRTHDAESINGIIREIEKVSAAAGFNIKVAVSETLLDDATSGHVYVFIVALILIALVMAVVGVLGLASSMGTSVIERTREFGIMRTIGARSGVVMRSVIGEGLLIGWLSWLIAIVLSLPLSLGIGMLIGNLAFRSPLPLIVATPGLALWFGLVTVGAVVASAYPAHQAAQLTIRETLAYI